jgi:hypothetical protein
MATDQGELERYNLPPAGAATSQEAGLSQWDSTLAREEVEDWEGVFGEPWHKPSFKGSSQTVLDSVFDNPEMVSPEARVLFEEFMRGRKAKPGGQVEEDLKAEFSAWLSEDLRDEVRRGKPEEEHFPPAELVLDPYAVSFDVVDFKKLWANPETRVTYQYHPGGKGGHLEFKGKVGSKERKIEVRLEELAKAVFGRKIFFGTPRTPEEQQKFWEKLKSLRVDDRPLAVENIDFIYPIRLSLKKEVVDRKFASPDRSRILEFNRFWHKKDPFMAIGFGFRKGAILGIALQSGIGVNSKVTQLPFDVFRAAYGVARFDGRERGRITEGADFGELALLTPATPCEKFIDIVSSISIDQVKLPPRTRVIVSDFSRGKKPTGVIIGYT